MDCLGPGHLHSTPAKRNFMAILRAFYRFLAFFKRNTPKIASLKTLQKIAFSKTEKHEKWLLQNTENCLFKTIKIEPSKT